MQNTDQQGADPSSFERLSAIDCADHIESKNGLSYLSWAWAVHYLLKEDPQASWWYLFWDSKPYCQVGDTAMVFCVVKAFGMERTAQLPVMNHRNQPIPNPNAFELNTAMQRCLAKAIALHGLGLYIYQGEDVPVGDDDAVETPRPVKADSKPKETVSSKTAGKSSPSSTSSATTNKSVGDSELKTIRALAEQAGVSELVIAKKYGVDTLEQVGLEKTAEITTRLQEVIKQKATKQQTEKEPA
jgi:hypothetical protein